MIPPSLTLVLWLGAVMAMDVSALWERAASEETLIGDLLLIRSGIEKHREGSTYCTRWLVSGEGVQVGGCDDSLQGTSWRSCR